MKKPNYNLVKISLVTLLAVLVWQCTRSSEKRNIRAYYYPIETFLDGKVYEYRAVNDSLAPFYWYFRTTISRGDTMLTSEYFDYNFEVQQLTNEAIVQNGVILYDFFLYTTDSITRRQEQNPVRVEVDNVFPFEVSDSTGLFLYKVSWKDAENPQLKYRLIRNKHFIGDDVYTYQGQEVPCVRFLNRELLEIEEEGFQELRYNGVELYAKDIGLVYFRKEIDNNIVQEYELYDVYKMSDLEKKFRQYIE